MDLINKAISGDQEAFIHLMENYKLSMYRTAKAILQNDEDAADAVQETILSCYKNIGTIKHHAYFKTWLTKIVINKCSDIIQHNRFTIYTDIADAEDIAAGETDYDTSLAVKSSLKCLSEHDQLILVLYYLEGFKIKEIARILNLNDSAVKTQLFRGRERFKKVYCEQEGSL